MSGTRPVRVAVIGGGISGMTVAHELTKGARRDDFSVTVFERRDHLGGKASSSWEKGLPAEHGFRFFPGFYSHVIETMEEIKLDEERNVACHLVELDTAVMADSNGKHLTSPLPTSRSKKLGWARVKGVFSFRRSMPGLRQCWCFLVILARLANTCEERWDDQLEYQSWLELVTSPERARQRSRKFKRLFAIGLTRSFVATRAEEMSARTGGKILLQLVYDTWFGPPIRHAADRALDGPTTDVWIKPWTDQLEARGVQLAKGWTVTGLVLDGLRVTDLALERSERGKEVEVNMSQLYPGGFDHYILAVPCEVLKKLLVKSPTLLAADPDLARVFNLRTKWMNGIVLGLTEELNPPLPKGHVLCLGSQWALTVVDQTKFWQDIHVRKFCPPFKTLLSVDISDWDSPGLGGLPAKEIGPDPQREGVVQEIWGQLCQHLHQLRDVSMPQACNLDLDIQYPQAGDAVALNEISIKAHNTEPLLINTPGSWANRPDAATKVANLFVAGDFARTFTNFASMEAANEAGKRAVNALLETQGYAPTCDVHPLDEPAVAWFAGPQRWARRVDAVFYKLRLPLKPPSLLPMLAWLVLGVGSRLAGAGGRETG